MRWHRTWGVGCLILSVCLLFLGVGSFGTIPEKLDDQRAYLAAESCEGAAATDPEQAADEPCLFTFTATVTKKEKRGRGSSGRKYQVTVRTEHDDQRVLGRFDEDPLAKDLQADDTLTVVTYREQVTQFSRGSIGQRATGTPDFKPVTNTVVGTSLVTVGGWMFFLGLCAVASARGMTRYGPRAVLPRVFAPVLITFLVPLALSIPARGQIGLEPVLAVAGAWFLVQVVTLLAFRKRVRPRWDHG